MMTMIIEICECGGPFKLRPLRCETKYLWRTMPSSSLCTVDGRNFGHKQLINRIAVAAVL